MTQTDGISSARRLPMQIKVTTNFPSEPIIRQTPGRSGTWKDCHFSINDSTEACDYWVVLDGLNEPEKAYSKSGRVILFTLEPPGLRTYCTPYIKQFDQVVTCHPDLRHPNVLLTNQGLEWHVGITRSKFGAEGDGNYQAALDYDDFRAMAVPEKTRLLSVICSNKNYLPGHRLRLAFVESLKQAFGDSIDVFGRGIRPMADKIEAIAPYRYHIALENSIHADYWTEKLSDTFIGFAHPFYSGCPNIGDYFDPGSLTRIDISRPDEAITIIKQAIAQNTYETNFKQLVAARDKVLDNYNTFEVIRRVCQALPPAEPRWIQLRRNETWDKWRPARIAQGIKRRLQNLLPSGSNQ